MTAYKVRREALLRAHWIDLDRYDDEYDDPTAKYRPEGRATEAERRQVRERQIEVYSRRISLGLGIRGERLSKADSREVADTDANATHAKNRSRQGRGRTPLSKKTHLPFAKRLNRDCREAAERLAKRYFGGDVPMPKVVAKQFAGEPDLTRKWAEHVRSLARSNRSR